MRASTERGCEMTERKSWAQIKAEKAAKREAKGKPPAPTFGEIREDYNAERDAMRERKRLRKAERKAAR